MRRFIFKAELEILFHQYKISEDESDRIKSELFKNPYTSNSKQYQLYNEIDSVFKIQSVLEAGKGNDLFIGAVNDIFTINEDLQIDEDLRELLLGDEKVAVFIGAGVSRLLGYPLWGELAFRAINYLKDEKIISFTEKEKLLAEITDPKQLLSIFDKFCSRKEIQGRKFYEDIFMLPENVKKGNPYDQLVSPYFDWLKVTSNVDFCLANSLFRYQKSQTEDTSASSSKSKAEIEKESFYEKHIVSKNFPMDNFNPDKLYYLHGRIDDIGESIFTTEDYIANYFSEETSVKPFLNHLFQNYNVIFLGYSLGELPILESVMKRSGKSHFVLMEAKYHERNVLQIKEYYYNQLGIKPIPYYTDHDGYDRLIKVLKSWEDEIIRERGKPSAAYLEERNILDEVVK